LQCRELLQERHEVDLQQRCLERQSRWAYLRFMKRLNREQWFLEHPNGVREVTGSTLTTPTPLSSIASQRMVESKSYPCKQGQQHSSKSNSMTTAAETLRIAGRNYRSWVNECNQDFSPTNAQSASPKRFVICVSWQQSAAQGRLSKNI
jgi:hypothetical protein